MTKIGSHIRGLKVRQFSGGRKVKQNIDDLVGCHIAMGTPGMCILLCPYVYPVSCTVSIGTNHKFVLLLKVFIITENNFTTS